LSELEGGINLLGQMTDQIITKTLEMMKIHPLIALLNHNLMSNLGYAATVPAGQDGLFQYTNVLDELDPRAAETFASRQELIAYIFRENAKKSGALLGVKTAGELFSSFSFTKLLDMVT